MDRTYMPMIDNGLFVAEFYLNMPYKDITIDVLYDNIDLFADNIAELIDGDDFYRKLAFITHPNSSFTQTSGNMSRFTRIKNQHKLLLDSIRNDKFCIYCGKKQVNIDINIDKKYMYGLVSQSFYNFSNNLHTVDVCPICAYLSMLSFLNIYKIGMPTLYISDSDDVMRYITKLMQGLSKDELDIDGKLKTQELINLALSDVGKPNYITQFCFMNSGQIISDVVRSFGNKEIQFLKKLREDNLLDEFINYRLHDKLAFGRPLITSDIYISPGLAKLLEGFELKEKERQIVEYATKVLLELEDSVKLLKELKLCNSRAKFNSFILNFSERKALVKNVKDYDILTSYNWYKYRDYITMNILIYKEDVKDVK